jgi:pilus assembly protein CpaC
VEEVPRYLEIQVGKSLAVETAYAVKRVSIGDPEILDIAVLSPRRFQLVAKAVGTTNVVVWDSRDRPQAVIDVEVGTAYSHIERRLREVFVSDEFHFESAGDSLILTGNVPNALAAEQALDVVRAYLPSEQRDRVINLLEVGGGQQVMLQVVIAEMSRSLTRRLGTNFHTVFGSGDQTFEIFNLLGGLTDVTERSFTFDLDTFELTSLETIIELSSNVTLGGAGFGIGSGVYEMFFDLLEREGLGKVMAEPTLVARSGETASFLVGGEVPIPIAQGGAFGSITIEFKSFGVGLSFTPTVITGDRIHLYVAPEVSEPSLTFGTVVGGAVIPSFQTRRASTAIELGDGQSFVIAGLLSENITELIDKYPVLGDIPVLGGLFRSSSFEKRETELVMIVTPRIVRPLPPGPHVLPTDHFIEPSAFEFYVLGRMEAKSEPAAAKRAAALPGEFEPESFGGIIGGAGQRISSAPVEEAK